MRDRDEAAFDAFAVSAMPRLRRLAYAWCHDWHHSDDVVQDTMERVYAAWPRVRRGGEEFAYARTTLVRRLITENRRAWRRRESLSLDENLAGGTRVVAPEQLADLVDRLDALELLRHLPVRQRAVAVLRFLEDLPISEVADLLQCSEGTIKSQAHHARRFLTQRLADPHSPDGVR
ncbi:RNA polymerase sigma factor [Kineococcus gynurae]|uniref:RNA polymerase sigma factor n=1 Tax=Kineococcus gynurae TaxID=452979 RepID=A0ABV5LSC9_9ACTN